MTYPTEHQIAEAKKFLVARIEAEQSMLVQVKRLIREAATRITRIAFEIHVAPTVWNFRYNPILKIRIESVLAWLQEQIESAISDLATSPADEEDIEQTEEYIHRETYGSTLDDRLNEYINRFDDETSAEILAGLYLGKSEKEIVEDIVGSWAAPYASEIIQEATKRGFDAPLLLDMPTSFGQGRVSSSKTAISVLATFAVAEGWSYSQWLSASKKDAPPLFWVMRGSSYPCELCDSYVGIRASAEELPPYHPHCKCLAVPLS